MKRRAFLGWFAAAAAALGLAHWFRPPGAAATLFEAPPRRRPTVPGAAHHDPAGGFRNPWPTDTRESGGFLRWQRERRSQELPPNPPTEAIPLAAASIEYPRAPVDELRITWVGHATFLIQIGGINLLTDPHWSRRASPVQFAGPARFVPPGIDWDALPPVDAVVLSHDHYDHLDDATVRRLQHRFGPALRWFTPLEYRRWLAGRRVRNVTELDWWEEAELAGSGGPLRIVALPCQHWTSRAPWDRQQKLWASWGIIAPDGGGAIYFGGDSGYFPEYPTIHERIGSFDALLLPIGAYEPRWFMRPVHMNPEEAVRTYLDLGGSGTMVGMHWGTWRLTDEDPLEPPVRTRRAWQSAGVPAERLWIPRHGETRVIRRDGRNG